MMKTASEGPWAGCSAAPAVIVPNSRNNSSKAVAAGIRRDIAIPGRGLGVNAVPVSLDLPKGGGTLKLPTTGRSRVGSVEMQLLIIRNKVIVVASETVLVPRPCWFPLPRLPLRPSLLFLVA